MPCYASAVAAAWLFNPAFFAYLNLKSAAPAGHERFKWTPLSFQNAGNRTLTTSLPYIFPFDPLLLPTWTATLTSI